MVNEKEKTDEEEKQWKKREKTRRKRGQDRRLKVGGKLELLKV